MNSYSNEILLSSYYAVTMSLLLSPVIICDVFSLIREYCNVHCPKNNLNLCIKTTEQTNPYPLHQNQSESTSLPIIDVMMYEQSAYQPSLENNLKIYRSTGAASKHDQSHYRGCVKGKGVPCSVLGMRHACQQAVNHAICYGFESQYPMQLK